MARVLPLATNVSFQLVCRAWLHVIPVDLLFMPNHNVLSLERLTEVKSHNVIWMKVKTLQSVDEVEQVKVVVNDPVQVKVMESAGEVREWLMDGFWV